MSREQELFKKFKKWGLGGVVALIALITALNSYTIVQDGTVKTQTFLGKVSTAPVLPGFHIVNPFASFDTFSTKDIKITYDKLQVPSHDKFKSTVDMTVMLQFDGSKAPMNRINAGNQEQALDKYVEQKLLSTVREFGKSVPKAQDLFNAEIQAQLQDSVKLEIEAYARPYGYTVKEIFLQDITLPEVIMTQVTNTKVREEQVNAAQADLDRVAKESQQKVKQAEADRDARENMAVANERDADAKLYAAQKEAEANKALQVTITPQMIEWRKLNNEEIRARAYKGAVPQFVSGSGSEKFIMDMRGNN